MIYIFQFALCALLLATCSDNDSTHEPPAPPAPIPGETPMPIAKRTVLIYCVAQNDLGISAWRNDSTEIANGASFVGEDDRLLVYVDDARLPRLYLFTAEADAQLVYQWADDRYSTNPEQLKSVVQRVAQYFPAEEYGLVCWSHSDGWLPSTNTDYSMSPMGFGIDVGANGSMSSNYDTHGKMGSQMNISAMAKAIEESGTHFRYIFFDSCLMQCIESCFDLRYATDYVVASPMPIPYDGAYYTHMIEDGLFADSVERIADTYFHDVSTMTTLYDDYGLVISTVKTDELDALAATIKGALASINWDATYPDMKEVDCYYRYLYDYYYRPHYYDLQSSIKHLCSASDYEVVCQQLSKVVSNMKATPRFWVGPYYNNYAYIDTDNCCGISMFVPQEAYARNAHLCIYGNHNETYKQTEWARAIGKN